MGKFIDLSGQRFGRLVVLRRADNIGNQTAWVCLCDCGNIHIVRGGHLKSGFVMSCGCLHDQLAGDRRRTHGHSTDRLYNVWAGMKQRCYNCNNPKYDDYGGRGIAVCEEWRDDYESFRKWALDKGYDENAPIGSCTIDRIDVDGNYEPSNCRWVGQKTQANNRRVRANKGARPVIECHGKRFPSYSALARAYGVTPKRIQDRIKKGFSAENAVEDALNNKTATRWSEEEDAMIYDRGKTDKEISMILGRSPHAIQARRIRLNRLKFATCECVEVEELSDTERSVDGFGSTGKE